MSFLEKELHSSVQEAWSSAQPVLLAEILEISLLVDVGTQRQTTLHQLEKEGLSNLNFKMTMTSIADDTIDYSDIEAK